MCDRLCLRQGNGLPAFQADELGSRHAQSPST